MPSIEQANLLGETATRRWANFDDSGRYRWVLGREWDDSRPVVAFVMLNPSTASEKEDDPTIRRCIDFAKRWGYGSLLVGNLFAFRATDPAKMKKAEDPVGHLNDSSLGAIRRQAQLCVAAWGAGGRWMGRDQEVRRVLSRHGPTLCLGKTNDGLPLHPLYQPAEARLVVLDEGPVA